jgi:hypothetical protein
MKDTGPGSATRTGVSGQFSRYELLDGRPGPRCTTPAACVARKRLPVYSHLSRRPVTCRDEHPYRSARDPPSFWVTRCFLGNLDHGEPDLPVMCWAVAELTVPDKVVFCFPVPAQRALRQRRRA